MGLVQGRCQPPPDETVKDPAYETKHLLSIQGVKLTWVIWIIHALQPVHSDVSPNDAVPRELGRISSVLTSALCRAGQRRSVQPFCLVLSHVISTRLSSP